MSASDGRSSAEGMPREDSTKKLKGKPFSLWRRLIGLTVLFLLLANLTPVFLRSSSMFQSLSTDQDRRDLKSRPKERSKYAYITVVCDEHKARSTMVLVHSIKSTKTPYDVVVLSRNISSATRETLASLGAIIDPQPEPFTSGGDMPLSSIDNLLHGALSSIPSCFQAKFSMWAMAQYRKVVFLDTSMLVLENIDDLFQRFELTAAPDNDLPDRFNPSLMLLEPSQRTFLGLLREYSRLKDSLGPPSSQDLLFFNHFFLEWPHKEPSFHLPYGYNAKSKLGYSATWNEWVHPVLKAVQFEGTFERWDDLMGKLYPPTRRYDHIRWEVLRDMQMSLSSQQPRQGGEEEAKGDILPGKNLSIPAHPSLSILSNPSCHSDFMEYSKGAPVPRKLSVLLRFTGESTLLQSLLEHYSAMRFVHKLFILPLTKEANHVLDRTQEIWNSSSPSSSSSRNPTPIVRLPGHPSYPVSYRFRPIESLETDCLLVCDERVQVSGAVLQSVFKYWLQHPHRTVGFFPSAHYRGGESEQMVFVGAPEGHYSMMGLKLLMMHSDYLQSYTCSMKKIVRDYVDRFPECEDIAFNILTTQIGNSPPLLMMDNEKRVVEDAASESQLAMLFKNQSVCLTDLESMVGTLPLRNTSEAKVYLEHDMFTKVEFRDPEQSAKEKEDVMEAGKAGKETEDEEEDDDNGEEYDDDDEEEEKKAAKEGEEGLKKKGKKKGKKKEKSGVVFEPIFETGNNILGDENFRFMSSLTRVTTIPEVVVMPSPQQPQRVLCVKGNSSGHGCERAGAVGSQCRNTYAISTYRTTPPNAILMLGTTLIMHSRHGFEDRFHTPNLVANFFYPYPDYGFMKPARAFFYKRGSLETRLSSWSRSLFKALLGEDMAPFRVRNGERPICFERAVMTRRYRPVAAERNIVLQDAQERSWSYCSALLEMEKEGKRKSSWDFTPPKHNTIRVLLLHGNLEGNKTVASEGGAILNLQELVTGLQEHCSVSNGCDLVVMSEQSFTSYCQQILYMGSADVFITVTGDSTMNHVIFMQQHKKVLELVPFGLQTYDPRVLKVYQEASRWMGLYHSALFEATGPPCPAQNPSCRFLYRRRPMVVDVQAVVKWLVGTLVMTLQSTSISVKF